VLLKSGSGTFVTPITEESPGQIRQSPRLPVSPGGAVTRKFDCLLDNLLLVGRNYERHDARQNPLGRLGLIVQ
jgi:hypothetical protein